MLLLALVLTLATPAAAAVGDAASWRWPLHGEVLTPFRVTPNPFAGGQHRGIDIAAAAGAPVLSACPGRVSFAGRVPRRGRAVTVVCGPLVATYVELGSVDVGRGAEVGAGTPIGRVAASHLQFGARRAGERHGYVDPLTLLRSSSRPPPLGAAPARRPRSPRTRPARPRTAPPRRAPRAHPVRARPAPAEPGGMPLGGTPLAAWLGLGLLAAGIPMGALVERRRRRARLDLRTVDAGA